MADSNPDGKGVEFRHSNGSQGIGFGFDTIYATGYDDFQRLRLKAKGKEKVYITEGDVDLPVPFRRRSRGRHCGFFEVS